MSISSKRDMGDESPAAKKASKKRKMDDPREESTIKQDSQLPQQTVCNTDPPTFAELNSYQHNPRNLLQAKIPLVGKAYQRRKVRLGMYLAPIDVVDPLAGVCRQLDDVLLCFVREAEGILMGWDAPRFLSRYTCVEARMGEELEGAIKLMGPSHIGILIHDTFNASIPRHLIPADWSFEENFDGEGGFWRDGGGNALEVDQIIQFKTINTRKGANILSVEGSLLEQVFQPKYQDGQTLRDAFPESPLQQSAPTACPAKVEEGDEKRRRKDERKKRKEEKKMKKGKNRDGLD